MINVTVFGAAGRMGQAVLKSLSAEKDIFIKHAVDVQTLTLPEFPDIIVQEDNQSSDFESDIWIDVSLCDVAFQHAKLAEQKKIPILIGATGFSQDQIKEIDALKIPTIVAPNLSVGINTLFEVTPLIRSILGDKYDVAVFDTHHRHKLDAPSGTAKKFVEKLNEKGPDVQVVSVRAGEVVGEHRILFAVDGEQIEIIHRAESRMAFARGVAPAIRFLAQQEIGIYTMSDVLGLNLG